MTENRYFKIVRDGYDKIARKYYEDRDHFVHDLELGKFAELLKKESSILDIGCGGAIPVGRYLIDKGFRLTGIDFSAGMLAIAKKNCPEGRFLKMNMAEMAFADNSFDGITAFYSIIHFPRSLHQQLFDDIYRILKPEGIMLICLGPDDWEAVDEYYDTKMFWSHYESAESLQIIRQSGFEILYDEILIVGEEKHYWILGRKNQNLTTNSRSF